MQANTPRPQNGGVGSLSSKKVRKTKRTDKDDREYERQINAYLEGYRQGFSAGWDEALTKSLASIVDIYGSQLAMDDLPDWYSDWNLVGADLQAAMDEASEMPDVAPLLAIEDPMLPGLLEPESTEATESEDDERPVVESK